MAKIKHSIGEKFAIGFFIICMVYWGYSSLFSHHISNNANKVQENSGSNSRKVDCPTGENTSYSEGYASGQLLRNFGGSGSCQSYVNSYNEKLGRDVLTANDCFCQGFDNGYLGKSKN